MYWDVKKVSEFLQIKTSTVYTWVRQGKIPYIKIHALIRFLPEEIEKWVKSFREESEDRPIISSSNPATNINTLLERAKKEIYNTGRETRPKQGHRGGK